MGYKIMNRNRYITFVSAILLLLATVKANAQCDQWGMSAKSDSSTCAASGKITITLTGTGAGSVTGILYSLEPLVSGGYGVSPNTSAIFENVPAGSYKAIAQGVCNGAVVSTSINVTVLGNYKPFTAAVSQQRITLHNCNTGQAYVTLANGKLPYRVTITAKPAAYTGRTFYTSNTSFVLDSLWAGSYTLSITDACGATAAIQTLAIATLPAAPASDFYIYPPTTAGSTCNQLVYRGPTAYSGSPFLPYINLTNNTLLFSVAYNGGARSVYKPLNYNNTDTITLPAGESLRNAYGKPVVYYIKTPCGEETVVNTIVPTPYTSVSFTPNCAIDFSVNYLVNTSYPTCYPVYVTIRNTTTNVTRYDTLTSNSGTRSTSNLPFGTYNFTSVTADGYSMLNYNFTNNAPTTSNPYSVSKYPNSGSYGNDGAVYFGLFKSTGNFTTGTTINLVSPSNYAYTYTFPANYAYSSYSFSAPTDLPYRYFYPGSYVFRITDACGTYDVPITVEEKDVYRYTLTYTQQQTCTGLKITPSGTVMYNNISQPAYFKILQGPQGSVGFDNTIIAAGGSLLLPTAGQYKIGMSSSNTYVLDYSSNGTGAAVKTINFTYNPLAVDINHSLGWVCPGQPDNSGSIVAVAINGSTAATGVYTYRLAALGKGATGPYLASNTTGKFSTATSGGAYTLIKNANYDIRVEDECGAAAVQTIKIIDFATAQVASSDKPTYCVGDNVYFKIINLPTTAVQYAWTGPDNFTSNEQNPVLSGVKVTGGGNYHVVINSDICEQSITGNVSIAIAPYIAVCYSAVTDTSVNPYTYGLLGNWRLSRSYTYYGARAQSDPSKATDIRHDGAFDDFISFWQIQSNKWKASKDTTRWVWNTQSTLFNSKGFELENSDPLGRYNSAVYGYGDAIPVAIVQNSRFNEAAYEGFEDYGFDSNNCDTACSSGRRFDFSYYKDRIDSSQRHTGKYSIRVQPGDTVGIKSAVIDRVDDPTAPTFNKGTNSCSPSTVLKSVRANKGLLLPSFSPLRGKKVVFSAWVKETQDCKCSSYVSNKITLAVTMSGSNTNIITATPVGGIIEGWQRYEQVVDLPAGATGLSFVLLATGTATTYFDDIRIHPYNANMQSFVYDARTLQLMSELDENNYATFYEYNDDGSLTRVKKETEQGIKTIKETRSALIKQ